MRPESSRPCQRGQSEPSARAGLRLPPHRSQNQELQGEPRYGSGYPQRAVPRNEDGAKALKTGTLTNLYNARPQWLVDAHAALDAAVAEERLAHQHLGRRCRVRSAGAEQGRVKKARYARTGPKLRLCVATLLLSLRGTEPHRVVHGAIAFW
ncbi:MAG: hypothetical protein F4060_06810 [Holophagales bacterium]|nr:hypothetical protein [Holophagales bacterium]MYG31791.1 hypothetical protein [Holophagales bacterium]MYI79633.1 hypothetical protein [Holophagales bacterium]